MTTTICATCHQPICAMRLGVRLTPLKAQIVDAIKSAGDIGISSEELLHALWERDAARADTISRMSGKSICSSRKGIG